MQVKLTAPMWVGIVVSVVWFNLFVAYFSYQQAQGPNQFFIEANLACELTLQADNDVVILVEPAKDRVAQLEMNRAKWRKCRDDIREPYRQKLSGVYKSMPTVAAAALGTIGAGWALAWLGISAARRIRQRSG